MSAQAKEGKARIVGLSLVEETGSDLTSTSASPPIAIRMSADAPGSAGYLHASQPSKSKAR
jgi:hypothetical protein